ncbi:MAG: hypothetical protein JHD15_00315 [Phenylobacterium sp.]|uniref:hypothetical protein n=1 Tax=Phenylobacterium sp. TaxID=1871053 RepID=UPI001A337180|nr:hypothetical protein [Phenylobacterium sp.]MBJ7408800.1 hypothetical protein [Phenylobacterium sp.]
MIRQLCFVATLASAVAIAAPALAQDATPDWKVSVTPYLWAAAYDNDVSNSANGQTSESSASFFDILDGLSFAFMGKAEVQYSRVGVVTDLVYMKLKTDRTTTRPILGPIETEATVANTVVTALGFFRVADSDDLSVDLLGGVRYVKLKLDFDVQGPGSGFSRDGSADITKATVGVRATKRLGAKTSLTGYGDFGGFGDDVKVWQLEGTLNYQWRPTITAFAGYRHFAVEIDKGPVSSDVSFSGPIFGTTFRF